MTEPRVALYLDFENLVASQYDAVHGRSAWQRDDVVRKSLDDPVVGPRLREAALDLDAIVDYATSLGVVTINRAYANWSSAAYYRYARALNGRAVELAQLFPLGGTKNGADIRLATDVIDEISRYPHLTHVVIAAGDSDYVAVAQKVRRLGRQVVGVGVAGSIGRYWEAACDEFMRYDALPGVETPERRPPEAPTSLAANTAVTKPGGRPDEETAAPVPYAKLFRRAMENIRRQRSDDRVPMSELKQVLMRMSPGFDESTLGHKTFSSFVRAQPGVTLDAKNQHVWFSE